MIPCIRVVFGDFCKIRIELSRLRVIFLDRLSTVSPIPVFIQRIDMDRQTYTMSSSYAFSHRRGMSVEPMQPLLKLTYFSGHWIDSVGSHS